MTRFGPGIGPGGARPGGAKRPSDTEASVSDVLGSILLVGITVVMAGAFGAVLLSYDGPVDQQHTQLAIVVGPGADGDWGTNDAELTITHIGGEDLVQGRVEVTYVDTAGSHAVSPTFAGGELTLGESWTQVISATPGVAVTVTVVIEFENGDGGAVLSSGGVTAGGSGATLTYIDTATPNGAGGTVQDIDYAKDAVDGNNATLLKEAATGGTPQDNTQAPATTSTGGAANPDNALTDNGQYAVLDASAEYVQGAGFTAPSGFAIAALSIGMEARAVQNPATPVAYRAGSLATNTVPVGSTITAASILPVAGDVLVAAVANGGSSVRTVVGVPSGPSGITWSAVAGQANSAGNSRLDVFVGTVTGTLAIGSATVTFSGTPDRAAIAVTRYSGVDTTNPVIQHSLAGEAPGSGSTSVSVGPVTGTTNGLFYAAINAATTSTGNVVMSSPTTERAELDPGSNRIQLLVGDGAAAAGAANTVTTSGTFNSADWQAIGLTLRPIVPALPSVTLSYTLAGCTCPTTLTQGLTTSDATYEQSILGDRSSWLLSDLTGVAVRLTYPTDNGWDIYVDRVYLQVTSTTTATTYAMQTDLNFAGVVDLPTQVFQMRYKVAGDTFKVYAMTGAAERLCPGTLSSAIYAVFTCALSTGEYNSGAPVMRVKDSTTAGTAQGILTMEYARVSSS